MSSRQVRPRYNDRLQAGYELAQELKRFLEGEQPIILAIPKGGLPVASTIATELNCQLDLVIPGRIQAPDHPEVTLGAVTSDRTLVVNKAAASDMGISDEDLDQLSIPVWAEIQRTSQIYRRGRPYPDLRGSTAVIVDDRLITGYTMLAAVISVRKLEPEKIVVAVPVSYVEGIERVRIYADEVFSMEIATTPIERASSYFAHLAPVSDQEVIWTLDHHWSERPPSGYSETF